MFRTHCYEDFHRTEQFPLWKLFSLHALKFCFLAVSVVLWASSAMKIMHFLLKANLTKQPLCPVPNHQQDSGSNVRNSSESGLRIDTETVTGHQAQTFESTKQCLTDFSSCLLSKTHIPILHKHSRMANPVTHKEKPTNYWLWGVQVVAERFQQQSFPI